LDTAQEVEPSQPSHETATRHLENLSLTWKIAGAIGLSVMIGLAIISFFVNASFVDMDERLEASARQFFLQKCAGDEHPSDIETSQDSIFEKFLKSQRVEVVRLRRLARARVHIALLVAFIVALAIGLIAARALVQPLTMLTRFTDDVARGDLTVELPIDGRDEIGLLANGFRKMLANMRDMVAQIGDATNQMSQAASQLTETLSAHAATSTEQSHSVHQTTATLEELTASSRQIADSSLAVVRVAAKTLESAKRGAESSKATVEHMGKIQEANDRDLQKIAGLSTRVARIDEIMNLINSIADQTKLIAFNAAIEAAAAGDAGRRFSVVSEEIRRLAEGVQARALEIRASIASVQQAAKDLELSRRNGSEVVTAGVQATERTSSNLNAILDDSRSVLADSKQISLATQEQRMATEQTLGAVRDVHRGVTDLAEGAAKTDSVVKRLSSLATKLRESVEHFEIR